MLADGDTVDVVIGVDTHKHTHTAEALNEAAGILGVPDDQCRSARVSPASVVRLALGSGSCLGYRRHGNLTRKGPSAVLIAQGKRVLEDLIEAGVAVFRRLSIGHPSLFSIGVQQAVGTPTLTRDFAQAAAEAFAGLETRVMRVKDAGLLGRRTVRDAACEVHALCEGLAAVELPGSMTTGEEARIWRDALTALVTGFAMPTRPKVRSKTTKRAK